MAAEQQAGRGQALTLPMKIKDVILRCPVVGEEIVLGRSGHPNSSK